MSETISPTFTFVKDGVFYFSRRIPHELKRYYTSPRIAYSLRTRSPRIAEARARKAADQLDEYWYHLRSRDTQLPGKHMLRHQATPATSVTATTPEPASASVLLSEAVSLYLQHKGKGRAPPPSSGLLREPVAMSSMSVATSSWTPTPRLTRTPSGMPWSPVVWQAAVSRESSGRFGR